MANRIVVIVDSLSLLGINPVFKESTITSWKIGASLYAIFFVTKRGRGLVADHELDVRIKLSVVKIEGILKFVKMGLDV